MHKTTSVHTGIIKPCRSLFRPQPGNRLPPEKSNDIEQGAYKNSQECSLLVSIYLILNILLATIHSCD